MLGGLALLGVECCWEQANLPRRNWLRGWRCPWDVSRRWQLLTSYSCPPCISPGRPPGILASRVVNSINLTFDIFTLYSRFTRDPLVVALVENAAAVMAAYLIADHIQGTGQGIFSAAGQQGLGAGIMIVTGWCVALPIAYQLGARSVYSLFGLYLGQLVGYTIAASMFVYFILFGWDWPGLSMAAQAHLPAS